MLLGQRIIDFINSLRNNNVYFTITVIVTIMVFFIICASANLIIKKHSQLIAIRRERHDNITKNKGSRGYEHMNSSGLNYKLDAHGIHFIKPGENPETCNCHNGDTSCVAECKKQSCGKDHHAPCVEDFIVSGSRPTWFEHATNNTRLRKSFVEATHISRRGYPGIREHNSDGFDDDYVNTSRPPDLIPEEHVETLDLVDKIKDNIFGRVPGLNGKGIKKVLSLIHI